MTIKFFKPEEALPPLGKMNLVEVAIDNGDEVFGFRESDPVLFWYEPTDGCGYAVGVMREYYTRNGEVNTRYYCKFGEIPENIEAWAPLPECVEVGK